jgi:hypothetical protein
LLWVGWTKNGESAARQGLGAGDNVNARPCVPRASGQRDKTRVETEAQSRCEVSACWVRFNEDGGGFVHGK